MCTYTTGNCVQFACEPFPSTYLSSTTNPSVTSITTVYTAVVTVNRITSFIILSLIPLIFLTSRITSLKIHPSFLTLSFSFHILSTYYTSLSLSLPRVLHLSFILVLLYYYYSAALLTFLYWLSPLLCLPQTGLSSVTLPSIFTIIQPSATLSYFLSHSYL